MKLVRKPNRWSCLPTAFSIVYDIPLEVVIERIGHDGSAILWPDLPEPLCRQGFIIEELQYVALTFKEVLVPFVPRICFNSLGDPARPKCFLEFPKFEDILKRYNGILTGEYVGSTAAHAVAWNAKEEVIYDPDGRLSKLQDFQPDGFHAVFGA